MAVDLTHGKEEKEHGEEQEAKLEMKTRKKKKK